MAPTLNRLRADDAELARRVGAGDVAAFTTLDKRHRAALVRYAGSLLRRSEHDAEDVVQDVLVRAHEVLRGGRPPEELRPWLFRLTRNRAIDEVRRKRWSDESLQAGHGLANDVRQDPETVLRRREALRRIVEDLADLPVNQRAALVARELDGQTPEQVAAQLGVSVDAAHHLATRARANLIRARDARDADCDVVRVALLDAHERGVRPTEQALRHRNGCDACRAYQRDIRRLSRRLQALHPILGIPLLAGLVQFGGGGATKAAVGAAVAVALAATGGIVVLRSDVHEAGDPAPFRLLSLRDSQGRVVTRGTPIPEGFTVVTARIRVAADPRATPRDPLGRRPGVTLPCPRGMKLGSLQFPNVEPPPGLALGYARDSIPGYSTSGRLEITHRGLQRPVVLTVGIDCRRPNRYGGLSPDPRRLERALERGERRLAHVCARHTGVNLRDAPGGQPVDFVSRGAPVAIQRRNRSAVWTLVVPDQRSRGRLIEGWMRSSELCE
jgi:RNA polymerase sigma factor (sigma-70 family)